MRDEERDRAQRALAAALEVLNAMSTNTEFLEAVIAVAAVCAEALAHGGKVMFAGNGGSAADAQHFAAELVGRFSLEREALAAIALTTDTSALTAIGNDYGFDAIFERQVLGLGRQGDVLIGLSTSGRSRNILLALDAARRKGLHTVGMTGSHAGPMAALCDHLIQIPSSSTPRIQEGHGVAGHIICDAIERRLAGAASGA